MKTIRYIYDHFDAWTDHHLQATCSKDNIYIGQYGIHIFKVDLEKIRHASVSLEFVDLLNSSSDFEMVVI